MTHSGIWCRHIGESEPCRTSMQSAIAVHILGLARSNMQEWLWPGIMSRDMVGRGEGGPSPILEISSLGQDNTHTHLMRHWEWKWEMLQNSKENGSRVPQCRKSSKVYFLYGHARVVQGWLVSRDNYQPMDKGEGAKPWRWSCSLSRSPIWRRPIFYKNKKKIYARHRILSSQIIMFYFWSQKSVIKSLYDSCDLYDSRSLDILIMIIL